MVKLFKIKKHIAFMTDKVYFNSFLHLLQTIFFSPFIRAINYHDISTNERGQFEEHLRYYSKHFSPVNREDLIRFHHGDWKQNKPGLIITFDDGFRSASEVVAPLLDKYGFTGWFFIPSKLIDVPVILQEEEATKHRIFPKAVNQLDARVFLTWEEIIELDKRHIVGCHTASHCRLAAQLTAAKLFEEIIASKQKLEEKLLHEVDAFAWVGGEEQSYSREASMVIRSANYKFVFLTNNLPIRPNTSLELLNRTNIESDFPLSLTRFQLSGILDVFYTAKRRRVGSLIIR